MRALFEDTLGFAGAKMIRRILGLAHVEDLELIADPERRAQCEAKALRLARELVLGAGGFASLADVTGAARAVESGSKVKQIRVVGTVGSLLPVSRRKPATAAVSRGAIARISRQCRPSPQAGRRQ